VKAQLVKRTTVGNVVVLRPTRSSYVLAAASVTGSRALGRSGGPLGSVGVWAFEDGVAGRARPTEYVASLVSTPQRRGAVADNFAQQVLECVPSPH
jgi:hypothetical protein